MRLATACLGVLWSWSASAQEDFALKEVDSPTRLEARQLEPRTIYFGDTRTDELADKGVGLIRFEEWARARPSQKAILSLYPRYSEPTIDVVVHGVAKRHKEKLHIYLATARLLVSRPPHEIDLARYAKLDFLAGIDPAIKHKPLAPEEIAPLREADSAHNRHPDRAWCAPRSSSICIQSRYQLEGKLPMGVRLANKLEEGGKKIPEFIDFQSELRVLPPEEIDQAALARLTELGTRVTGVLEQSIFHVNQMMQFGKFLAVLQEDPADPNSTIATVFVALAVETDVLEKKKEYESVPVLRNLVPSQVLMGNSSFNTGSSISAGLPNYARNQIKAVGRILDEG